MPRIYTKTGDDGTTGLIGERRVSKDSLRIEACGSLDELNAMIGVVRSNALPERIDAILQQVQEDLFALGSELALPEGMDPEDRGLDDAAVRELEMEIDAQEARLAPVRQFILPGGAVAGAELHLARAVARRAERHCVSLSRIGNLDPRILRYLNRLSDLLFVLARAVNMQRSVPESHPAAPKKKNNRRH
jgi:cob(I)alamin adenosyltransferase